MISSRKEKNVNKALESFYQSGCSKDQLKGLVCHVGNKEDRTKLIEQTLKDFGGIDILVSNAAINPVFGPALDVIKRIGQLFYHLIKSSFVWLSRFYFQCPEDAWDKIFDINVKAPFLLTQEVKPHLLKKKGSSIVYVSSIAGYQPFAVMF